MPKRITGRTERTTVAGEVVAAFIPYPLAPADPPITLDAALSARLAADRARVLEHEGMSFAGLRLFELLPRRPIVTVASVMTLIETTKPTAGRAIELLVAAGVLVETTGKKRDRSFVYAGYLERLRVGTELHGRGEQPRAMHVQARPGTFGPGLGS